MEFLKSMIESRVAGAWELKSDLDQLRDSLLSVNYLMEKAEWWRFKNPNIARLLVQLQDSAYDAEDVIAEFDYYELQKRIEGQITSQLLSSFVSFIKNVVKNSASKVKDVHAKLNSISSNLEREIGPLGLPDGPNPYGRAVQRPTSSINPEKVFGRENELEMVVKLMMEGSWAERGSNYELSDSLVGRGKRKRFDNISILLIVGGGGVGKTTLAQLIYSDVRVKKYFDLKIWVCVSDYFDLKRVTREMIESANVELSKKGELRNNERQLNFGDKLSSLESLQQTLHGKVESKRCLIVLDDIWHEQSIDFECLCNPLRSGLQGSMVLITTRLRKVAELVSTLDPIQLTGLPDNIYWDFFKKCAFGSLDPSFYPELENIGKKIADRLKGSPLAAKTLGGILYVNMTTRQWRNIMNSKLWEIKQADGDILPVLRVSYQYLPVHLKRCFLICSLFPKDYHLFVDHLSPIWMADGIIPHEKCILNDDDNKAEAYFRDLQSRSFILSGEGRGRLHDHMHDLAKSLSRDTCYCQEDHNWYLENHLSIRHLSVYHRPIELIDTEIGKCKKLRSLLFLDGSKIEIKLGPPTLASLFDQLPYLRVLNLDECQILELPDNIGKLKLLFYINLRGTKIRSLPESMCQLYNLQVVNVKGCPLKSFPKMFNNLINLRLIITDLMKISSLIPGIGKLTFLEKLQEFNVLNKDGHKLEELKNMTRLRGGVKISNLENVKSRGDASEACLNSKEHLTSLSLRWSPYRLEDTVKDGSIIEGLKPHSNLEELIIMNYGGVTPASWLQSGKLSCLQRLSIIGSSNLESLEDWFVRHQLLSLRKLIIKNCVKLASLPLEWIASSSLSTLLIKNCPLLSFPSNLILPSSLTYLEIDSCSELHTSFPCCLQNVYSLKYLELYNCHYATSLSILQSNHLKELSLRNCAELQYLELSNPSILEILEILKCPKLMQSDPLRDDNKAPTEQIQHLIYMHIDNTSLLKLPFLLCPPRSLEYLEVSGSPEEKMFIGDVQSWLSGLEYLAELVFVDCSNLESLPEELHTLETLKVMRITNCPKIQSLPENGLPPSLNELHFDGCHPALIEQLEQHKNSIMKGKQKKL